MVAVSTVTRPHAAVLDAVLERLTYVNEETGYTVARVATSRSGDDLLTVVGALLGAQPGESLRLSGRWSSHPKFGRQFEVESYTTVLPATIQGIQRYLGSGLVKGIGPVFAERIVAHFGLDTLRLIEEEPGRLIEVPGLGPKRTTKITVAWQEQRSIKEVMVFLQGVGVSTSLAVKIFKKYGDASISVVKNEPYRLAADVWGIGFKTADTIAQAVGIPHDSPERVKAGLQYTLSEATDNGHCYLPQPQLVADAVKILGVPGDLVGACLADLVAEEGVVRESLPGPDGPGEAVYLVPFHRAETSLAGSLQRLLNERADRMPHFGDVDWGRALGWLHTRTGTALAPEQEQAVRLALTSKVAVLTGGPGCGKSFTVRSIVALAAAKKAKIQLVAPTGRAAKRLAQLRRGPAGAGTINTLLQQKLTPGRDGQPERRAGGRVFRVGDKVTQIRNNYDKGQAGVFNGTLGIVTALSTEDQTLTVRTDEDETISYDFDELDELAHAYAMTIHRSQGSEYPAVVIPLTTSAWMMLQRNLLYTAVTRAKQLVVLVGSRRVLAAAVRTVGAGRRRTALGHRLNAPWVRPVSEPVDTTPGTAAG